MTTVQVTHSIQLIYSVNKIQIFRFSLNYLYKKLKISEIANVKFNKTYSTFGQFTVQVSLSLFQSIVSMLNCLVNKNNANNIQQPSNLIKLHAI